MKNDFHSLNTRDDLRWRGLLLRLLFSLQGIKCTGFPNSTKIIKRPVNRSMRCFSWTKILWIKLVGHDTKPIVNGDSWIWFLALHFSMNFSRQTLRNKSKCSQLYIYIYMLFTRESSFEEEFNKFFCLVSNKIIF